MMERGKACYIIEQLIDDYGLTIAEREALKMAVHDIEFVDLMPADVAPVVRCRECKHHKNDFYCLYRKDDDFCSWGERREDG